ncbi:MAG TPA: PQQ-binding-like beta-propeller repeat protein [Tepidisphaeraceae bacterium]
MSHSGTPTGRAPKELKSILLAVSVRVAVYAFLCLVVLISLADFHSLSLHSPVAPPTPEQSAVSGPGWPHFRGPTYDAHSSETELANTWPAQGPPILWSKEIGPGYSGFIVHGNRAYTQTQALTEQKVLALDADTGQVLWQHGYNWPYQAGGMFPGPRSTPTWSNDRVYFVSPTGLLGCLNALDGHPLWSVNVVEKFDGRGASFGYACSPVVEDGKIILPVGGPSASMVALNADTGTTAWTSGASPASYSSALPITFQGRRQIVTFLQNTLAGFDLQTGRLLWEQSYLRGFEEHAAALLYDEPYLRATQAYRAGSDLYALEAGAPGENIDGVPVCGIKRVRHDAQMSNDVASSVMVDGFVYGFDLREMQANGGRPSRGSFRCMDFKTGQVRWSSDRPGQSTILVADGKLFLFNDSGQLLLLRINPDHYEELGRADIFPGETCWTAPALDHGRLYLRSPTRAACLYVGNPQNMTPRQRTLTAPATTIPKTVHTNRTWLVGAERDYPFEMPDVRELKRWYLFSLCALAAAAMLAGITFGISRVGLAQQSERPAAIVFWIGLFTFGTITTPLVNHFSAQFIFTWPLTLIAVHQIALAAVSRPRKPHQDKRIDWPAIASTGLLFLSCLLYFKLTKQLSLIPGWYFLLAFPAAWPLAVPAARRLHRPNSLAQNILWLFAVFTVYFWAAGTIMLVRTALG